MFAFKNHLSPYYAFLQKEYIYMHICIEIMNVFVSSYHKLSFNTWNIL